MGVSVTKRIKEINQSHVVYIKPTDMEVIQLPIFNELKTENLQPNMIGLVVEYLTSFMLTKDVENAFEVSIWGAEIIGEREFAYELLENIYSLDDTSIACACELVKFDVYYRQRSFGYCDPRPETVPNEETISNIREMVERSIKFFNLYGPVTNIGFTFEGGYTNVIDTGDGDFLTKDTLWDFKVSKNPPTKDHTLQLLIYYLMGKHSDNYKEFNSIKYLGVYNPRLNKIYRYPVDKISSETINEVEKNVIGY